MNYRYSAAVVGLGRIGSSYSSHKTPRNHTAAYINNENVKMIAGIDPSTEARREFKNNWGNEVPVFSSVVEMLNEGLRPDIVSICTTPEVMQKNIKDFHGYFPQAYFLEKPAAYTKSQCIELLSMLDKMPVAVNYHRCWDPKHQFFLKSINSKKIYTGRVLYSNGLANYASHIIALLLQNFGKVNDITKISNSCPPKNKKDVSLSFALGFDQGFSVIFQGVDNLNYEMLEIDFITNNGIYSLKSGGCRKRHEKPIDNLFYENYTSLSDALELQADGQVEGLQQAIENIVNFLDKKTDKLNCDLQRAIEVVNIINEVKNLNL